MMVTNDRILNFDDLKISKMIKPYISKNISIYQIKLKRVQILAPHEIESYWVVLF